MISGVNSGFVELNELMAVAPTKPNEISFFLAATRKGSQVEDLPKLNELNESFQDQNLSISLSSKVGKSKECRILGFRSAEWKVERNGNRKLIVYTNNTEILPIEISNSQTTIKFQKLASDLEVPKNETRISAQNFSDEISEAAIARAFHQGLVRAANVGGGVAGSNISPKGDLQLHLKYLKKKTANLDEANKSISERFSNTRVAIYINGKQIQGINFLSNTPLTIDNSKRGPELGIEDSLGHVHKLTFNDDTMLRIVENPPSKEEIELGRPIDKNNQRWEWSYTFLHDEDNLQKANERLMQEGFHEGRVSIYKNGELRSKLDSLREINPLSYSDKGLVIYDASETQHSLSLSDNDFFGISKLKPKRVKTYLLEPEETRKAHWKSFLSEFVKPKTGQPSGKEKLEFDFTDSAEQHKLSKAYSQLSKKGFLKREVEIYSANKQIFKGFLREGDDALVYDRINRQIKIYNQQSEATIVGRANFKTIKFVKTDKLAPQDLTVKANSAHDFVKQLNGLLARLPDGCTLKIEGLKDPLRQDLVLRNDMRVSFQGLKSPHEFWLLCQMPHKIQPELGRKYNCIVEKV